jgi:hypothetical protein
MVPMGFEPKFSAGEGPQTYTIDCAAIEIGVVTVVTEMYKKSVNHDKGFFLLLTL